MSTKYVRRTCLLLAAGLFCVGWAGLLRLAWAASRNASSPPGDVIQRAKIAQANLLKIAAALNAYATGNLDRYPSDLRLLYPGYISDPAVFWNPGDSDSCPATINNNTPNTPNSTRISYEYTTVTTSSALCSSDAMVWDNSAQNNGGWFINIVTANRLLLTNPPFSMPTPARVDVARHNLKQIAVALYVYAANNSDRYPTDPGQLLQLGMLCSPSMYWHPGDSDPEPTAITNSVPNAINSSQISYDFLCAGQTQGQFYYDDVIVRDNSPSNNGGTFINTLTGGGQVLTDPPFSMPIPTRVQVARSNLRSLAVALFSYTTNNMDRFPDDPVQLMEGNFRSPAIFWHPGDSDPQPTQITNSIPNAVNSSQISYDFLCTGHAVDDFDYNDILIQDNTLANNGWRGVNVIRADGHLDFISRCHDPFADADGDSDVDAEDFAYLQRCLGPLTAANAPECVCMDHPEADYYPDGNGVIDADDIAAFITCGSGAGVRANSACDDG